MIDIITPQTITQDALQSFKPRLISCDGNTLTYHIPRMGLTLAEMAFAVEQSFCEDVHISSIFDGLNYYVVSLTVNLAMARIVQ